MSKSPSDNEGGIPETNPLKPVRSILATPSSADTKQIVDVDTSTQTGGKRYKSKGPPVVKGLQIASSGQHLARIKGASIASVHSATNSRLSPRRKRVRFFDRLAWRSISAIRVASTNSLPILETPYGDYKARPTKNSNYLAGLVDLIYLREIFLVESSCCWCDCNNVYHIMDEMKNGRKMFRLVKEAQATCLACIKCCPCNLDEMRIGFNIKLYCAMIGSNLVSFNRTTHCCANQLDIVETFYSLEKIYLGRIEKTKSGYRILNEQGVEIFRVSEGQGQEETTFCCVKRKLSVVAPSKNHELIATIVYAKRRCIGKVFPLCAGKLIHSISWDEEIQVSSKVLILGVLLLELNSDEKFVDLPLGGDAVNSAGAGDAFMYSF